MLSGSEKYYDDIYTAMGKDYFHEAEQVHEFIRKHKCTDGRALLDVACGSGVLLIEPWFTPDQWTPGRVSTIVVEKPDVKIVRMSHSGKRDRLSLLEFHYLVGTSMGLKHIREHHEFGLFPHNEYSDSFARAGLKVTHESDGVDGWGLYSGTKPAN